MKLTLKRIAYTPSGTFGVYIPQDGIPFAVSLENPWKDNQQNVSCIPEGVYLCTEYNSPKFGRTFQITDVPDRGLTEPIIFHWGNLTKHTRGCPLIGEQFGVLLDQPAILSSKIAFYEFLHIYGDLEHFVLSIEGGK